MYTLMTRYHVFLSSYDIDTESKNRISTKKQTNNNNKRNKNKKNKRFFTTWSGVIFLLLRDFMKESAGFTHDEPNARKEMQA